jgi:hypothetical protein
VVGAALSQLGKYAEAAKGIKPNLPPEFTPVGDEPQRVMSMFADPVEAAYGRMLATRRTLTCACSSSSPALP